MLGAFKAVRREERRATLGAFAVLFFLHASHALLETARDALFLGRVPATRLPLVYVGLAVVSLAAGEAHARLVGRTHGKRALASSLVVASLITALFFVAVRTTGTFVLYLLYVWPAVLAGVVVLQFWSLLGDVFTITQAKRLYAAIGVGSIAGAIAGNALAGVLGDRIPADLLLVASSIGLLITAFATSLLRADAALEIAPPSRDGLISSAGFVAAHPFARRIVAIALATAVVVTLADYLFKSTVAATIPRDELGSFFARTYLVLNLVSLASQTFLANVAIRKLGVPVASSILPALMLIAAFGPFLLPALPAVLLLKGAEGGLRHSLHRTAFELLGGPLPGHTRALVKRFVDIAGYRGGQAIASLAILCIVLLPHPFPVLSGLVVGLSVIWLVLAAGMRKRYVAIFRRRLGAGPAARLAAFPDLDAASLETVVASLDADDDSEVLAAMEVLERDDKAHLVPKIVLFHPSEAVVRHALALFARTQRRGAVRAIDRLLREGCTGPVRATAIAVRTSLLPERALVAADGETEEVRAAQAVCRVSFASDGRTELETILDGASVESRVAVAEAIAVTRCAELSDILERLAGDRDRNVQTTAIAALGRVGGDDNVARLIALLARDETHGPARECLASIGEPAFDVIASALVETTTGDVRRELPALLARVEPRRAAQVLVDQLARERDGLIRYRIIRALEGIAARNPDVDLERDVIRGAITETLTKAYRYLDYALVLERGAQLEPNRVTPGHRLLRRMLDDKRKHAVGRLFRLLGLAFPTESFVTAHRGITSDRPELRAASVELLDNVLPPSLRSPVLGLVDDLTPVERFQRSSEVYRRESVEYPALIHRLANDGSSSLREAADHHARELAS